MIQYFETKKEILIKYFIFGILAILWSYSYFSSVMSVPFHPDESTQIFMSEDLELLFNNTSDLFYNSNPTFPTKQNYRLLDAPLTKYSIGLMRIIFGYEGLHSDWDWSKSWDQNSEAIPENNLLFLSRIGLSIFFPISIYLFYLLIKDLSWKNYYLTFLALMIYATNSLFLLHTRRAMAEGLLIFFLILCLYTLNKLPKKWIFISAIPISFAINAKQSLIFFLPVALVLIFYYYYKQIKTFAWQTGLFLLITFGIFYCLNPILWREPIKVFRFMVTQRQALSENQLMAISYVTPEFTTTNTSKKLIAFIAQVFINPPAPQEIGNYQKQLNQSINEYFKNPIHKGYFRNLATGTIFFLFSMAGFIISFFVLPSKHKIIYSFGFLFLFIELILFINLPFQRYFLPAIPFMIIFTFIGLFEVYKKFRKSIA
jgi:hypothetical protein